MAIARKKFLRSRIEAGNAGTDTVRTTLAAYSLTADVENLTFTGGGNFAGTGNGLANTFIGGSGNDTFDGGADNDTVSYSAVTRAGVNVDLAAGTATPRTNGALVANSGSDTLVSIENVIGTSFADSLLGSSADNTLAGNAGDDTLDGRDGNDRLVGGVGNDTMIGGLGNDTFVLSGGDVLVENAGEGSDTIETAASLDLNTLGAAVSIENLTLTGAVAVNATGNALDNVLTGNSAVNTLDGGDGTDTLIGGSGNDVLIGGLGSDTLDGGAGADSMTGGAGDDTYVVDDVTDTPASPGVDVVTENAGEGIDLVRSAVSNYTLAANVENLTLTGTAAVGTGNALANIMIGNASNNTINGAGGADSMIGGAGNDNYVVDDAGDTVVENFSQGTDRVTSSVSYQLSDNVENLVLSGTEAINATGNALANTLTGNSGNNVLDGGAGGDSMAGGQGDDAYFVDIAGSGGDVVTEAANAGRDTVSAGVSYTLGANVEDLLLIGTAANALGNGVNGTGNTLNNRIDGSNGNNTIAGKGGNDTLSGLGGNDIFLFDTGLNAASNVDTITDFTSGSDVLHLENAVFTRLTTTGPLVADQLFIVGSGAQDANDYVVYNSTTGALSYDSNGSGAGGQTLFATLLGAPILGSADFLVI